MKTVTNLALLSWFIFLTSCQTFNQTSCPKQELGFKPLKIDTVHGVLLVDDPLAVELIESAAMQRLKNIRQYGTTDYVYPVKKTYSRFTHSLGVYYLLKKFGLARREQIAGLLHDVSHTAFSHASDALFMGDMISGAYQDLIHVAFLKEHGLEQILKRYGMNAEGMDLLHETFLGLKQKHPDLCADRIEYIIYAGYKEGDLSFEQINKIHEALKFDGRTWFFMNKESAKAFARISLVESLRYWGGPESLFNNFKTSDILAHALRKSFITKAEITYDLSDDELWHKINLAKDDELQSKIMQLINFKTITANLSTRCAKRTYSKFRGVDPLVQTETGMARLSEIDSEFSREYKNTYKEVKQGWCLPSDI